MARSYTTAASRRERARVNRERRERGETIIDSRGNDITAGRKAAKGGHPTDILNPRLIKAIAEVTARGVFPHHAAASLGVNESTFRKWMLAGKKGEDCDPLYIELYNAVDAARAKAIAAASARLQSAGEKGIWQADARMLESMAASDWMRTEKRLNEGGEAFLNVLDELKALRARAEKAGSTVPQTRVAPNEKNQAPDISQNTPDSPQITPDRHLN